MRKRGWTPEVLIVWTPGDGQLHIVPAHRVNGVWSYGPWQYMPESDEAGFLAAAPSEGFTVFDVRKEANKERAGMGRGTPIIIYRADLYSLKEAVEPSIDHKAILTVGELTDLAEQGGICEIHKPNRLTYCQLAI